MTVAAPVTNERDVAATAAIAHHYDIGNEFYELWLDSTLSYSCAMPTKSGDTLEDAQARKLQYHLDAIDAGSARAVLDIGCGWGAILERASRTAQRVVGLTLSEEQAVHIRQLEIPGVDVRVENWTTFRPDVKFDGIVSIGAFEHFATPDDTPDEKIAVYRDFFSRCRGWLNEGGTLSLQTIAYANMSRESASSFMNEDIFPNADLPTLAEIVTAADGIFEVKSIINSRLEYAWTCEQWARRLREHRTEAVGLVGPNVVKRYERYLKLSALGFRMGKICLLRLVLVPYSDKAFTRQVGL